MYRSIVLKTMKRVFFKTSKAAANQSGAMNAKNREIRKSRENVCRKALLFSLLFLFCTATLFAANPVTVKSGDVSVIKKPSIAFLEIDFSNTKVGVETLEEWQKRRGDDFVRDWPDAASSAQLSFIKFFNKKNNKGMQLTTEAIDVSYKIVVKVENLNVGDSFSIFLPFVMSKKAGGMLMNGSIDIIDIVNNNVVCTLDVQGVKGVGSPYTKIRLQSMFNYLADSIYKLK